MPRSNVTATLGEYADYLAEFAAEIPDHYTASHITVGEVKALVKFVRAVKEEHQDPFRHWVEIGHAIENLEGSVTL